MRKIVTLVLCLMMLLTSAALAEGMGVQVIGGPAVETEPVSLDDFKKKYSKRVGEEVVLHTKQFATAANRVYLPLYMSGLL